MKRLADLLPDQEILAWSGDRDIFVNGIEYDSRRVTPGSCYMAVKGFVRDGIHFIEPAVSNGAVAVVTSHPPASGEGPAQLHPGLVWVQIRNDRRILSHLAAQFYDNPSRRLAVIGVTGTNGKSSTMALIHAMLQRQAPSGWLGTLGMGFAERQKKTHLTTPEAPDIFAFLAEVEEEGGKSVVMEVSSASLSLLRVEDIFFSQAVFTSFSGDHLDFHQRLEDYFAAKLSLFRKLGPESWAIVNADDPRGPQVIRELACKYLTFGFTSAADVRPAKFRFSLSGLEAVLETPRGVLAVECPLIGRFNLANVMAAAGAALVHGVAPDQISAALRSFKPVHGRAEIAYREKFTVIIDYAHTDGALASLLQGVRELVGQGRIILVFGAGGDRDKTKRPRMGRVAAAHADYLIVTSDNPRGEDPAAIVSDIVAGIPAEFSAWQVELDRALAIERALDMAQAGDVVVIAGKGHEDYQIFKDSTIHFSDYEVVAEKTGRPHA